MGRRKLTEAERERVRTVAIEAASGCLVQGFLWGVALAVLGGVVYAWFVAQG